MSEPFLKSALRNNVWLIVVCVLLLGLAVYRYFAAGAPSPTPKPTVATTASKPTAASPADAAGPSPEVSAAEKAMATIQDYQNKFDAAPKAPKAPEYLDAMGNLYYVKLGNYKEAARCYNLLITSYPNWENIKPVYHQLATCYERINDRDNEQRVYNDMMKVFPPDSQEYLWAKKRLGL